ncbi:peptidoglycan-binding protein [Streptomyces sp. NPDC087903]|uniref:peptidoglycan-binding domain-containing protein n=1 Tax=Streptomyces sp. NPDC087903 TaxID=3365819 RepID=UPI003820B654
MDEGRAERVDKPKGHLCPECGAPRGADNTPSCDCRERASDALLHTRTAEAAAAEDFDPLRIRPYVELEGAETETGAGAGARNDDVRHPGVPAGSGPEASAGAAAGPVTETAAGTAAATVAGSGVPAAEVTMALRAVAPGAATAPGPPGSPAPPVPSHGVDPLGPEAAAVTMPIPAVGAGAFGHGPVDGDGGREDGADATTVLPTPLAPSATAPSATDLSLFEADGGRGTPGAFDDRERPRRRGRTVLLGVGGAVVAVVAVAGFASGLFTYEAPSRNGAAPEDVRVSVPDPSPSTVSNSPSAAASSATPTSASPSPSASASPSPSSASPSASSASPSPSLSASPTQTTPAATPTASAGGSGDDRSGATVLRRGDKGPEVVELQLRLTQLFLYDRDPSGSYNEHVEDAVRNYQWSRGIQAPELGVYDRATRARLESETQEP